MTTGLKPFWRYYGGKYRAAPRYPAPRYGTIIEPFAGAAGYSLRYPDRNVILVDKYPVIAGIWRYLIRVSADEIRRIPDVAHVDELPTWVSQEARWLVGFNMNFAIAAPCKQPGRQQKIHQEKSADSIYRWENMRERIASQVDRIRHWRVIEDDWFNAPNLEATWFVDPPYNNKAGSLYVHGSKRVDFDLLARGCRTMRGQVIVCENEGADWLPFREFATIKAGPRSPGKGSKEVIWTNDEPALAEAA